MMESENDLQIVASLSNSSKFANGTDFGFAISFDDQSPVSTPPPCAEYDSENTLGSPHSQLVHAKGPQRKLIYPVGASEQHQFKRIGMANKRIPSRLQNVKVVPEGEDGSISMDFLEFPDFNPPTISRGFLTEDYPKKRCAWITLRTDPLYVAFHDEEWGVPVYDDRKLFELLVFAGAQSEISWSALLVKREALREFFAQFDPAVLAEYDGAMVASLRSDSDIMRSATRVESIISNAKLVMQIVEEHGSLGAYMWGFVGGRPILSRHKHGKLIPARTAKSEAISKDLQRRGFRHAGPIAVYSFMQAAGLANDHLLSCFRHPSCSDIVTPPVAAVRTAQIQLRRPSSPSSPAARKSLLLGSPRCFAMYS
ncbi:hypothetical protein KP509_20G003100 [Ceratopteris richardii]|uniref:DNA-3-methyladenine glycosylase I n=1 Tax=Ceratopteris richardii TaxID=49495 RepID=A0A8T2SFY8_CERRI|nr:hypothetical protein KP509_20G003100 [Ceratopteris richardii]